MIEKKNYAFYRRNNQSRVKAYHLSQEIINSIEKLRRHRRGFVISRFDWRVGM